METNSLRLPDGRYVCGHCHQTGVYHPGQAQTLFEQVAHIVVGRLGLGLNVGTDFTLVDHQHLQRLAREASPSLQCEPARVIGLFMRKGRGRVMYVLSGLPQTLLIETIAHEWAHAWQGENCPLLQDSLVREGFAEWVAHKTLQTMVPLKKTAWPGPQDGVHAQGLRAMLGLEQRHGISGVLAFCRRAE
jgi:hypothetical protein